MFFPVMIYLLLVAGLGKVRHSGFVVQSPDFESSPASASIGHTGLFSHLCDGGRACLKQRLLWRPPSITGPGVAWDPHGASFLSWSVGRMLVCPGKGAEATLPMGPGHLLHGERLGVSAVPWLPAATCLFPWAHRCTSGAAWLSLEGSSTSQAVTTIRLNSRTW